MSARIFYVAVLVAAGYWSLCLAYADWLFRVNTPASVKQAAELDPNNARYHAWLAEIEEYEGRDPSAELHLSSTLNPSDSSVWIRYALYAEQLGEFKRAEQSLVTAARIDKLYAPRWALANYYARRGDSEHFWPWARQALEMGYDDLSPIFRLCWSVSNDAEAIRSQAIPQRADVLGKYLAFLTRENRLDAAAPIAREVNDWPLLLNYCDRLIEAKRTPEAVAVWRSMFPASTEILTNGSFESEPLQQGFDWWLPAQDGITVNRHGPELRFRLSGKQSEHCELLYQFVPVTPGKEYLFRFEYKTPIQGLRWNASVLMPSSEWTAGEIRFAAKESLERLTLTYDRDPGSVRAEGEFWLRNASIALQ